MRLHHAISVNGKEYPAGSEVSPWLIYPFFLLHMGMFGGSGFALAYFDNDAPALFRIAHGGIAIVAYVAFYRAIFGIDALRWMAINAAIGAAAHYVFIEQVLALFGKQADGYPWSVHAIPFVYTVLYAFLLRQAVIDFSGTRDTPAQARVEWIYVILSLAVYAGLAVATGASPW